MSNFPEKRVRVWMRLHSSEFRDPKTGEVNCTELAEACARDFGADGEGGWLDDETHPVWDLAANYAP